MLAWLRSASDGREYEEEGVEGARLGFFQERD